MANQKKFTITFVVETDKISDDGKEDNYEGFINLLDNLLEDGMQHAEPQVKLHYKKILMEDKER